MPHFQSREDLYGVHRALFERFRADPVIGPALSQSGLVLAFKVSDPDGLITIDGRAAGGVSGAPFTFIFGETDIVPDLTLIAPADLILEFWQGKTNIVSAIVAGKIRFAGNISAAMKLMPALKAIADLSVRALLDIGRGDLVV
jgi:hypothetical protein